jgi:hypothetical protein
MWYFAYGANMLTDVLVRRRGIIPRSSEKARIEDYRLVFQQPGLRIIEPCFANIQPTLVDCVYGVLHDLAEDAIAHIDRFEGASYERFMVKVNGANSGWVQAWAYRSRYPVEGRRPSQRYRDLLIAGALEFNLPREYITYLKQVPCVHLPFISWLLPPLVEIMEGRKRKWQRSLGEKQII